MSNQTRWTLVGVLIAVNVGVNTILGDGWLGIAASAATGVGVIALLIDYLVRGREG
ncbi:hypothetical protein GCM10022254_69590 [Actinomadura meridiana]|uniref:Uncharacterized protein n=1 Tax=Actinomadura meridiana TaxID=559626 RepID=A0ABP8CN21_9ACTN